MTLGESPNTTGPPSVFSEYFRILNHRRRMLILFVAIACSIAILFSFIGPETWRAQVTMLPEEVKGGFTLGGEYCWTG